MTVQEALKALKEMRVLAAEAIDLANRCHGGHSYESIRSSTAKKCCEVRMQVDDLMAEFVKLSSAQAIRETPRRRSRRA